MRWAGRSNGLFPTRQGPPRRPAWPAGKQAMAPPRRLPGPGSTKCPAHTAFAAPGRLRFAPCFITLAADGTPDRSCPRTRATERIADAIGRRLGIAWISGARGRIRTADTRIFNPLLYQLSYPGIFRAAPFKRGCRRWEARLWRSGAGLASPVARKFWGGPALFLVFRVFVGRAAGKRVSSLQPLHQIAVLAAGRAERSMDFAAGLAADRAALLGRPGGRRIHNGTACANPLERASAGSALRRIVRPVRRASSASHAGLIASSTRG